MPSLQTHHTFHLPAQCQYIHHFSSSDTFLDLWHGSATNYLLGGGSNTLFLEDFEGQVFINTLKGISYRETKNSHIIKVASGENWHELVTRFLAEGWHGLENLALIPGSVGAAPIQNIGAYGVEAGNFIAAVEYRDIQTGETNERMGSECLFGYRDSIFKSALAGHILITHVTFELPKKYQPITTYGDLAKLTDPSANEIYNTVINIRRSKLPDPDTLGNAGSFFKNPVLLASHYQDLKNEFGAVPGFSAGNGVKVPAAWFIDQCGFKGKTIGGVRCHPDQPLVLTNANNASGDDVISMAQLIMQTVNERYAVPLEPEVRLVGSAGAITL
ncbi:UDP-N-acetylmuramate dehydrogenase [Alteromonas sp. C1M14]|uniref:UDP-N-acetylmuramate dehydrogenase n=1 Tax=Alteromonas sp. C1M14 TaxID=2841567 RepID=UPI001C0A30C7|nr:UDP-N-acetylmuramate dehydrogenase [Alteromonas sp. C1M14]